MTKPVAKGTEMLERHAQHSYSGHAMRLKHMSETAGMTPPKSRPEPESPVTRSKRIFSNMKFAETTSPASQPLRPKSLPEECDCPGCHLDSEGKRMGTCFKLRFPDKYK